jgi:hypothetical protein
VWRQSQPEAIEVPLFRFQLVQPPPTSESNESCDGVAGPRRRRDVGNDSFLACIERIDGWFDMEDMRLVLLSI